MRMKMRWMWSLCCALCALCVWNVVGQNRAEQLLERMKQAVEALGGYAAEFSVEAEGMTFAGTMTVDGERYRISMEDVEVWGDAEARYEVNHARREITLTETEHESTNLLSNPARAWAMATDAEAAVLSDTADAIVLLLTPKQESGHIRLWLDAKRMLPTKMRYEQDGLGVDVRIKRVEALKEPLPPYDVTRYATYELIDFR